MAQQSRSVELSTALALVGAFLATLIVLVGSTANGSRPWIVLMRAGGVFLLVFEVLRITAAGTILLMRRLSIRNREAWIATPPGSSSMGNHELKPKGVS
jgi:hypothetical protein